MTLNELLKVCDCEMYISQDLELGVSGSEPVFHYHLTSGEIPKALLEREVKKFSPAPTVKYGRPNAVLNVYLKGHKKY